MQSFNLTPHRKHKLTNSYKVRDYYKHYKKTHKTSLSEKQYSDIVSDMFSTMIDDYLLKCVPICFPYKLGLLEVCIYKPKVVFEDGTYKFKGAINWKKTMDFWRNDPEGRAKKQLIYISESEMLCVYYMKSKYSFKNQKYICFHAARAARKYLYSKIIKNDNFNIK